QRIGAHTVLLLFSSRRRHTTWPRDWSSDVCSSDLDRIAVARRIRINGAPQILPRVASLGHEAINVERLRLRPGRKYSVHVQRKIIRAYLDGATITELACELGTHWETIREIVHRYGIQSRWRRVWATAPVR